MQRGYSKIVHTKLTYLRQSIISTTMGSEKISTVSSQLMQIKYRLPQIMYNAHRNGQQKIWYCNLSTISYLT